MDEANIMELLWGMLTVNERKALIGSVLADLNMGLLKQETLAEVGAPDLLRKLNAFQKTLK